MNILKFKQKEINKTYLAVSVLGKALKLNIKYHNSSSIDVNKEENEIDLFLPKAYKSIDKSKVIDLAIKKLYNEIATIEIENAMEIARHIFKFAPEDYVLKELNVDYYRIRNGVITVSPDIVKYSREVINTTILQAFCKIKYRINSANYKNKMQSALVKYEQYKLEGFVEDDIRKLA
jgi:hypothetical protein